MAMTKIGILSMLVVAGLAAHGARGQDKNAELIAKVDKRVHGWQPTAQERRLDDIAWAKDLRDGLRLAKEHGRPVFLFTYNGCAEREHAIALQRC